MEVNNKVDYDNNLLLNEQVNKFQDQNMRGLPGTQNQQQDRNNDLNEEPENSKKYIICNTDPVYTDPAYTDQVLIANKQKQYEQFNKNQQNSQNPLQETNKSKMVTVNQFDQRFCLGQPIHQQQSNNQNPSQEENQNLEQIPPKRIAHQQIVSQDDVRLLYAGPQQQSNPENQNNIPQQQPNQNQITDSRPNENSTNPKNPNQNDNKNKKNCNRGVDLFETLLYLLFRINDNKRLDLNITIGVISRTVFFFVAVLFRDLSESSETEIAIFILPILVFHIFIYSEKNYIKKYQNLTHQIELFFLSQLILFYLQIIVSTFVEIVLLVLVYVNLLLWILQTIYFIRFRKFEPEDYTEKGGLFWAVLGFFIGCFKLLFIFVVVIMPYIQWDYYYVYVIYIGLGWAIIISGKFAYDIRKQWDCGFCKAVLCFFYGLNVGYFSLIYGFFFGAYMMIIKCKGVEDMCEELCA